MDVGIYEYRYIIIILLDSLGENIFSGVPFWNLFPYKYELYIDLAVLCNTETI